MEKPTLRMHRNCRGEMRLSNFPKKKISEIYISSVNIISRRKEGCSLPRLGGRVLVGGGPSGIPWSDDTLKNSLDICSKQIHLREYSYLRQFSWFRKPLLVASGSY